MTRKHRTASRRTVLADKQSLDAFLNESDPFQSVESDKLLSADEAAVAGLQQLRERLEHSTAG